MGGGTPELKDKFEKMGAQIVKEVAYKTSDVAGDGTATTVLAMGVLDPTKVTHTALPIGSNGRKPKFSPVTRAENPASAGFCFSGGQKSVLVGRRYRFIPHRSKSFVRISFFLSLMPLSP